MSGGMLRIRGTLDLAQFWSKGSSDADTVKVTLAGPDACAFRPHPGAKYKTTRAFEGAKVKGRTTKAPIDDKRRVTVRLQGIDAPELHYQPQVPAGVTPAQKTAFTTARGKGEFRQPLAESATAALGAFLGKSGAAALPCEVRTAVDAPNEVFDTYGRAVADVVVKLPKRSVNLNHWLAEHGWAFPTYYASMSEEEIVRLEALCAEARAMKRGAWPSISFDVNPFDFALRYRPKGAPAPDVGPSLMPKLFRRQSVWAVAKKAQLFAGSFAAWAKAHKDECYETADYLEQGAAAAKTVALHDFVTPAGLFTKGPGDVVFREAPSRLVGADGKPVAAW